MAEAFPAVSSAAAQFDVLTLDIEFEAGQSSKTVFDLRQTAWWLARRIPVELFIVLHTPAMLRANQGAVAGTKRGQPIRRLEAADNGMTLGELGIAAKVRLRVCFDEGAVEAAEKGVMRLARSTTPESRQRPGQLSDGSAAASALRRTRSNSASHSASGSRKPVGRASPGAAVKPAQPLRGRSPADNVNNEVSSPAPRTREETLAIAQRLHLASVAAEQTEPQGVATPLASAPAPSQPEAAAQPLPVAPVVPPAVVASVEIVREPPTPKMASPTVAKPMGSFRVAAPSVPEASPIESPARQQVPALKIAASSDNGAVSAVSSTPAGTSMSRPSLVSPGPVAPAPATAPAEASTPSEDGVPELGALKKKRGMSLIFQAAATLTARDTASLLKKSAAHVALDEDGDEEQSDDDDHTAARVDNTGRTETSEAVGAALASARSVSHARQPSAGFAPEPAAVPVLASPATSAAARVRAALMRGAKASPAAGSVPLSARSTSDSVVVKASPPATFTPQISASAKLAAIAMGGDGDSSDDDSVGSKAITGAEKKLAAELKKREAEAEQPSLASVVKAITFARNLATKAKDQVQRRQSDNAEKIAKDVAAVTAAQKFAQVMRTRQQRRMSAPDASAVRAALLFGETGTLDTLLHDDDDGSSRAAATARSPASAALKSPSGLRRSGSFRSPRAINLRTPRPEPLSPTMAAKAAAAPAAVE